MTHELRLTIGRHDPEIACGFGGSTKGANASTPTHSVAMAMAVLLLLGLNVLVGALGSPRQAISRTERRDMDLARAATFRRFRRDVEEKNGNLDRVVCVLLELGSPWCEKGQ
ncbi:uncharacterized protein LOC119393095 [Rhipicephalus sanguineus]|uniref:uncharacterized protein LOC119393095 n=1 Tax=Rhipicephalus sanguineus TaxID=34632 RepID=UPI001893673D|nr:uncharacterized protein LOC119393095 [Rhipicephalus sanguineus]